MLTSSLRWISYRIKATLRSESCFLPSSSLFTFFCFPEIYNSIICLCCFNIIKRYLDAEPRTMLAGLDQRMAPQFAKLNKAFIELVMALTRCWNWVECWIMGTWFWIVCFEGGAVLHGEIHTTWFEEREEVNSKPITFLASCMFNFSMKMKMYLINVLWGSIQYVLSEIDKCIQFGEDAEVKIRELDEDMDQLEL